MSGPRRILSDSQIESLYADGQGMTEFARRIEAAVLANIESSTMLLYGGHCWTKPKQGDQTE